MALLPALFMMKINGHYAALALTGGSMGGHSFSSGRSSPLYAHDHHWSGLDEREKFDKETLSNFNNIKKKTVDTHINPTNPSKATHMVVTILAAFEGKYEISPSDIDAVDIGMSLKNLQSFHKLGKILAVNVLWAPQSENETMSCQELQNRYPHMKMFNSKK